jgi:hypothetical protein
MIQVVASLSTNYALIAINMQENTFIGEIDFPYENSSGGEGVSSSLSAALRSFATLLSGASSGPAKPAPDERIAIRIAS